jgi:hypothetical protein
VTMLPYVGGTLSRRSEGTSAVLVIRAWHEQGTEPGSIRARLTHTPDADVPGWKQTAAEGEDAILAAVRDWLHAFHAQR